MAGNRVFKMLFVGDAADLKKAAGESEKALDNVGKQADGTGSKLGGLGKAFGNVTSVAAGFVAANGLMKAPGLLIDAAKAAAEDEQATARLEQALRNAGGSFDENLTKVNERIDAGQKLAYGDDDIRDSFQSLLAATGDTDEALKRQAAAMDLARGAGIPLATATKMLGKLNEENVEVFKKMGITLGEGATEADALAAVQAKFGGQAETYAKSTAGQFEIAKIKMGEVKESIGAALLPVMTKLGTVLVDEVMPKVEQFAAWITPRLAVVIDWMKTNVGPVIAEAWAVFQRDIRPKIEEFVQLAQQKFGQLMEWLKPEFAKFQQYYQEDIKPAMDNVLAAVQAVVGWIVEHWPQIEAVVRPVLDQIMNQIEFAVKFIKDVLNIVIQLLGGDWAGAWEGVKTLIGDVWEYIKNTFTNGLSFLRGIIGMILTVATELGGALKDGFIAGLKGAGGLLADIANGVIDLFERAVNSIIGKINDAIPNKIALPGLPDIDLPDNPIPTVSIPRLASGGIVTRPTLALIGEAGPEAVVPLSGPNAGHFGGVSLQVNLYGDVKASSESEARQSAGDLGYNIWAQLRARGVA